jgi:hypothetical protein
VRRERLSARASSAGRCALGFVLVTACASATTAAWEPRGSVYEPGQSIAQARMCTCHECIDRACCSGDPEAANDGEVELGMTLAACGRCVRRVWTVRGDTSCASLAGPACCAGTVSD